MNQAVIGVGSNINPERNISQARKLIEKKMQLLKRSNFVITKPIGFKDQPDFHNGAWLIKTSSDLDALKEFLHHIENQLNRIRTENKFGPRTIDLDVVVWNHHIIDEDVYKRDFLKESVLELCPELANQIFV